jgi:hypothetical protein
MFWLRTKSYSDCSINLHVEEDRIVLNQKEFLYETLLNRRDIRCFSRVIFPLLPGSTKFIDDGVKYPETKDFLDSFNDTYVSKMSLLDYAKNWNPGIFWNLSVPISFVKYPETTNFKNGLLIVTKPVATDYSPKVNCIITTKNENGDTVSYIPDRSIDEYPDQYDLTDDFLPKCTLTGNDTISVGSTSGIELTFSYRDINSNMQFVTCSGEIKADKGYITHRKFSTNDGTFSFKFIPLGLNVGEIAKVQVGLGKYTDVVSKTVTVV